MKTKYLLPLLLVLFVALSYLQSFREGRDALYGQVNELFVREAPMWSDSMCDIMNIPYRGRFDDEQYRKKTRHGIIGENGAGGIDTILISTRFYHPPYSQFRIDTRATFMMMSSINGQKSGYNLAIADSLFALTLAREGLKAEAAIELNARDLKDMFPTEDSLWADAPIVLTEVSRELEGEFTTDTVWIGWCDHGWLNAHVRIPASEVWAHMSLFGGNQFAAILLALAAWLLVRFLQVVYMVFVHTTLLGNTCIDLHRGMVYLWSGERRTASGNQLALLKMLLDAAPTYRLSKDVICQSLWGRDTKDGQALYNTTVSGLRKLFVAEDESLELKTLSREGVELLIDKSHLKKARRLHFFVIIALGVVKGKVE